MARRGAEPITLFLCGDVMTGRGIDQILPRPSDPRLDEPWVEDAREYVALAESKSGPVPRRADGTVDLSYPWGDALDELARAAPDVRIVNLETSVTTSDDDWPSKEVRYRMHPANVGCVSAARVDACVLANNHVLDFGHRGLVETLRTLESAAVPTVGAGLDDEQACRPLAIPLASGRRVLVIAVGHASAGVPADWAAGPSRPGIAVLPDLTDRTADRVGERVRRARRDGDVAVASVHWGSNWGYDVPAAHVRFAHRLVDHGVDLVHGHSSHHPRPIEIYRDRLILYGAGDFLNDYEGIGGYEAYRGDRVLAYFAELSGTGALVDLRMTPFRTRRLRLERGSADDARWLAKTLDLESRRFGTRITAHLDRLVLDRGGAAAPLERRSDAPGG